MIKAGQMHPVVLASSRLLLASLFLLPVFLRDRKKYADSLVPGHWKASLAPGLLLGIHFASWNLGARLSQTANASLIVNMVPLVMPFLLIPLSRERINKREIIGTLIAVPALLVLHWRDYTLSPQYFRGDLICFASMIFFAAYMALGRRNKNAPSLWLYITPLYFFGGLTCLLLSLFFPGSWQVEAPREYFLLLGLVCIPTLSGHTLINQSLRNLRGQTAGLFSQFQSIFAALMAWGLYREVPDIFLYPTAVLIIVGGCLSITGLARSSEHRS